MSEENKNDALEGQQSLPGIEGQQEGGGGEAGEAMGHGDL